MKLTWRQTKNVLVTKLLPCLIVYMVWGLVSPTWMNRDVIGGEFDDISKDIAVSLERTPYRVAYFGRDIESPGCPGSGCLLNPDVDKNKLPVERVPFGSIRYVFNPDAWRGTMYTRWDLTVPEFAKNKGDPIEFDFYGVAGRKWRFFVNGELVAEGSTGVDLPPVRFSSPGRSGEPLVIGFEINVGRRFAPGLVTVAQPFLSRPGIAKQLRIEYRALDALAKKPVAMIYAFIATLAALACFFTPFYMEILAFALYVGLSNWRMLLGQGMAGADYMIIMDFVTLDCMLRYVSHACLWMFFGFYFRVNSVLRWVPVPAFASLAVLCFAGGVYGYVPGVKLVEWTIQNVSALFVAVYLYGTILAAGTMRSIWNVRGAWFRQVSTGLILSVSAFMACVYVYKLYLAHAFPDQVAVSRINWIRIFDSYALHSFVGMIGLVIALEWSVIVRDRQVLMEKFGRIVDPKFFESIIRGPRSISKRIDQVVVLFVDLRGFTSLCEKHNPETVTDALNSYLDVVMRAVSDQDGIVDKIVGDAVMAVWGVPERGPGDAKSAVTAAKEIRRQMTDLNKKRQAEDSFPLAFGIGIHAGAGIFTTIGNGQRVDHTVIGSVVNVSSRIQTLTKEHKCDILISAEIEKDLDSTARLEDLGLSSIRGMSESVRLYKVVDEYSMPDVTTTPQLGQSPEKAS